VFADFADVARELRSAGARFLIVGAYAMAAHGVPRATGDLDLWVEASARNASRVWAALARFGAPLAAASVTEDFARADTVFQIGVPPRRIDVMTTIDGVDFHGAWKTRKRGRIGGVSVNFIGRAALIRNKRSAGRTKDLADIEALGGG
jgi:hypothetical protein